MTPIEKQNGFGLESFRLVKQKRALLKSNPPRDNRNEGDEIKTVSNFGEANASPIYIVKTFISEPSYALKNLGEGASAPQSRTNRKNTLNWCPFFRSKPTLGTCLFN